MPNPQTSRARYLYWWLWLAPLLLFFIAPCAFGLAAARQPRSGSASWLYAVATLALGLPHLWLLIPALVAESEFVRWHAWQALGLVFVQTLIATLSSVVVLGSSNTGASLFICVALLVNFAIWLMGNLWGNRQVRRGDCALMRWFGRGTMLPLTVTVESIQSPAPPPTHNADALVEIIRTSHDSLIRGIALAELGKLGMVEEL